MAYRLPLNRLGVTISSIFYALPTPFSSTRFERHIRILSEYQTLCENQYSELANYSFDHHLVRDSAMITYMSIFYGDIDNIPNSQRDMGSIEP